MSLKNKREFHIIINEIIKNKKVQEMKKYNQHCDTTCYEHCKHVAYINYLICKKLKLDYKSAARAGMLHDFFLYEWRNSHEKLGKYHAFAHPKIALKNAKEQFKLNKKEKNIIETHMWPVTFLKFPKYRESFIITLSDKYCAIKESLDYYKRKKLNNQLKYAYMFMFILFINIKI